MHCFLLPVILCQCCGAAAQRYFLMASINGQVQPVITSKLKHAWSQIKRVSWSFIIGNSHLCRGSCWNLYSQYKNQMTSYKSIYIQPISEGQFINNTNVLCQCLSMFLLRWCRLHYFINNNKLQQDWKAVEGMPLFSRIQLTSPFLQKLDRFNCLFKNTSMSTFTEKGTREKPQVLNSIQLSYQWTKTT